MCSGGGGGGARGDTQRREKGPVAERQLIIFYLPGTLLRGNLIQQFKNCICKPKLDCSASQLLLSRDHEVLSRELPEQEVTKAADFASDMKPTVHIE